MDFPIRMLLLLLMLVQHSLSYLPGAEKGDVSPLPNEVLTESLPRTPEGDIDFRYMPVLSNGHISTTVYSGQLFLNGLYEGAGADSHRAIVPPMNTFRLQLDDEDDEKETKRQYSFNADTGVFTEFIDAPFAYVEHRTYVHQHYIRVLVSDVYTHPKGIYGGKFNLIYNTDPSPDIDFSDEGFFQGFRRYSGTTRTSEVGPTPQSLYVMHTPLLLSITVIPTSPPMNTAILMAVDKLQSAAQADIESARNVLFTLGSYALFQEHTDAWQKTWARGKIEVTGNLALEKLTSFSQYYLQSSLSSDFAYLPLQFNAVYYGATRSSLGKGSLAKDYQGHMFWDTEMYMMPALVLFHPDSVKKLLRYRPAYRDQAQRHAENYGQQGLRYPWESAFSGIDVTPDSCETCRDQQIFVSGAVSWAIRQYWMATGDMDFIRNPDYVSCDITRDIAKFYASLANFNSSTGRYDIGGVTGPDDYHTNTDNNAFTNYLASLSIHWARYFACICNRNEKDEVPDEWINKAMNLSLPFDEVERIHFQYEGYAENPNKTIKQADATLLSFPLSIDMPMDVMRNDLRYYEQHLSADTPALSHSFLTIGWRWVHEEAKMIKSFLQSYQDYLVEPFKIWTELPEQKPESQQRGSVNFLPGMGGFLQSLVFGFAGIRLTPESMEFHRPQPPPGCDTMKFTGFDYLDNEMDITIEGDKTTIEVRRTAFTFLDLQRNDSNSEKERLSAGSVYEIEDAYKGFFLVPSQQTSCPPPADYIHVIYDQ